MKPLLITAPAEPAVTLAEMKDHAIAGSFTDDDDLLTGYVLAAIKHLDGYTGILGRCLVNQDWKQGYCAWDYSLSLPFPDVSAASITYLDGDGVEQTVPAGQFEIIEGHSGASILFKRSFTWPDLNDDVFHPVHVTFTAGYGDSADVPQNLKVAIMQLATHWYDNRRAVGDEKPMPMAFDMLVRPYRMVAP